MFKTFSNQYLVVTGGLTATKTMTISFADGAPTAQGGSSSALPAITIGTPITAIRLDDHFDDPNGDDTLTYSVPAGGFFTVDSNTRSLVGTVPDGTVPRDYSVVVTAFDGTNPRVTKTFTFTVPDAAPVSNTSQSDYNQSAIDPGRPIVSINLNQYFTEPNGQAMTFDVNRVTKAGVVMDAEPWSSLVVDGTDAFLGVAPNVAAGTYLVEITARDVSGNTSAARTFTVIINDVDPAVVSGRSVNNRTIEEGGNFASINFSGYFTDGNGDSLTYELTVFDSTGAAVSGSGLTIDRNTGLLTANGGTLPANLDAGTYTVRVNASDATGTAATISFTMTVTEPAPVAPPAQPQSAVAPADAVFDWVEPAVVKLDGNVPNDKTQHLLKGAPGQTDSFNVDGHTSAKFRLADIIFGFEFNDDPAQSDKIKVDAGVNVGLRIDRNRDLDGDGNLDTILFFGTSVVAVIDNFTGALRPGHVLKSNNTSYTGADAATPIASGAFSTLDGGGKGRDYLIGRDNTADNFVIDLRHMAGTTGPQSETADANRFANADIIHNFDTDGADKDKITVKIDSGNYTGSIRVDDRFNIIGATGTEVEKKDAIIYEATSNKVLAVVSDVGDFDWSGITFEDEADTRLSAAVEAHLPDIS
jgi:hypothetical protein